jgi:hypothetical protein
LNNARDTHLRNYTANARRASLQVSFRPSKLLPFNLTRPRVGC